MEPKYKKDDVVYYCGDKAILLTVYPRMAGFPDYEIEFVQFPNSGLQMIVQENELDELSE